MAGTTTSVMSTARRAERTARGPGSQMAARLGYVTKGVVNLIIGFLAARVAIGGGGKTTDNTGALHDIYQLGFGRALLVVVAIGLFGYALWCFLRALFDADRKGSDAEGLLARIGYGAVGIFYAALGITAVRLVSGSGSAGKSSDASTQDWTARLLNQSYGQAVVIVAGLIVIGVAMYLWYYAYSARFMQSLQGLSGATRTWVTRLGRFGYAAQGVVFAEIGIFLIIAARQHDPKDAKGIGGSLGKLAGEPYGHVLLAVVAIGLIAYGLYSFAQARYRRIATV